MVKYTKDELEKLIIEENKSYNSIGKMFGVTGAAIKKAAKKFGITTTKRREINPKEIFSHPRFCKNSLVNRISDNDFKEIVIASYSWKEIGDKLGYQSNLSINVKNAINNRCETLGISLNFCKKEELLNKTKGSLFSERKNWQSARTAIRKNATETYFRSNKEHKCAICGYNKHIEVAHIKAVSDFSNNATIREINSITNLIGLCPNHHWEYDHGLISL
jgi:hypothetical protein